MFPPKCTVPSLSEEITCITFQNITDTNVAAHVSPAFRVEEGDVVTVGQCRPISKTVRFNVLKVSAGASRSKKFSKF